MKKHIHPVDIHVGLKLREVRVASGKSQTVLAELIGISFQQVQKYESGANRISASRLYDVSKALKTDIRFFFDGIVTDDNGTATSNFIEGNFQAGDLKTVDLLARFDNTLVKQQIGQLIRAIVEMMPEEAV